MDAVLAFFSDLILFTAGLVVATLWVVIIIVAIDELIDLIFDRENKTGEEEN